MADSRKRAKKPENAGTNRKTVSFSVPIGTRKDYSGLDMGVAIGWMWGRGDIR